MIIYDAHKWVSLLQLNGSIFPRAIKYTLPSTVLAGCVKLGEKQGLFDSKDWALPSTGSVYSGFTFVLGFTLVFRTSQSYARYMTAANSAHKMRAEWYTACASLLSFAQISKQSVSEVSEFANIVVRLFALMHAMALEEIAEMVDENFPLLDIAGFQKADLQILGEECAQGRKVEIVFQWIQTYIVKKVDDKLLTVPPPILTRVYQQLGNGLLHYHEAQQIVIWPFPYPYAQMNFILVIVYCLITPLIVSTWTTSMWSCGCVTFISVMCMLSLDFIAMELENPFGDDPNDLPTFQMQHEMNRDLLQLLNPQSWTIPRLLPTALSTYDELIHMSAYHWESLQQSMDRQDHSTKTVILGTFIPGYSLKNSAKFERQDNWKKQEYKGSDNKMQKLFDTDPNLIERLEPKLATKQQEVVQNSEVSAVSPQVANQKGSGEQPAAGAHAGSASVDQHAGGPPQHRVDPQLYDFFEELSRRHLQQHAQQQSALQVQQLAAIGTLLKDHVTTMKEQTPVILPTPISAESVMISGGHAHPNPMSCSHICAAHHDKARIV